MANAWIYADRVLTDQGWETGMSLCIGADGRIKTLRQGKTADARHVGILLPAVANLHSHAFQRAMAGLSERRGPGGKDSFWTWRKLMFRFLDQLTPDDIQAIAALVQMEMLESGYAANVEFHYLHHQPDGSPYANLAQMAESIAAAADETGIGLTLLPVLYQYGGCDQRPLGAGQRRFGNDPEQFCQLVEGAGVAIKTLPEDTVLGIAPHSLRAVSADGLSQAVDMLPNAPLHIHIAEQQAEVDEVQAAHGARPVEWLLANHDISPRWCLIHATHMQAHETRSVARSGAVAGLCPITESNLGDGIFDGVSYFESGGRFGVGSDSNIRISLTQELRTLEYSQRLQHRGRAVLAKETASTGRVLYAGAAIGGAQSAGRDSGEIREGALADLLALDSNHIDLTGRTGDAVLDSLIFAGSRVMISDVWSAGRHVVRSGKHIRRAEILRRYSAVARALGDRI